MAGEQKLEVELKARTVFKPEAFRTALDKAGFEVRSFELVVCAAVERREGRYYLQPADLAQQFAVTGSDAARKLEPLVGKPICVRGRVGSSGPPLDLEILELATLRQDAPMVSSPK